MKALFICNQNQHRSKTAEELFKDRFETKSAGLYNEIPVKEQDLEWADKIFVMEDEQRLELSKRFPKQYLKKQILSLNIPDIFHFNQSELISLLNFKMTQLILTIS
ncbi:phosphotyrosine protein phosphatase [Candidatus Woesearchaeota archaeon]|nr:phosphotyrosine protein phosphatase [Candidatus Woesearchaeota archaeon]